MALAHLQNLLAVAEQGSLSPAASLIRTSATTYRWHLPPRQDASPTRQTIHG